MYIICLESPKKLVILVACKRDTGWCETVVRGRHSTLYLFAFMYNTWECVNFIIQEIKILNKINTPIQ